MHKLLFSCILTQTWKPATLFYATANHLFRYCAIILVQFELVYPLLWLTLCAHGCIRAQSAFNSEPRVLPSLYLETSKKSAEGHNYTSSRCVLWNQQRDWSPAWPHVVSWENFFFFLRINRKTDVLWCYHLLQLITIFHQSRCFCSIRKR